MRILMIEDDKELAEITKLRLEKDNFTVDVCLDGAEGLYYMQENMYDLVILDRMLPSMDGTQVLKEARKANVSTPVIFLTALGELEDKITGLDCGADDYTVKPFAFEELLALPGVDTMDDALALKGRAVSIRRTDARLPKGEYFDQELEGCAVVDDATGEELGKLDRVLLYPAHKVYQVRGGAHEYLIPAVPGVFIASIDPEAEIIRVHMMKGLATDEN